MGRRGQPLRTFQTVRRFTDKDLAVQHVAPPRYSSSCRHQPVAWEGEYATICCLCGVLLERNLDGGEDYCNDIELMHHTPSPVLHEGVSDKKHVKIVEALQLVENARVSVTSNIFKVVHDVVWDFAALPLKRRIEWPLLVDCVAYYCSQWMQQPQFYAIWNYGRSSEKMKHWHACETLLIQHLPHQRHIFEYRVCLSEATLSLFAMGGLSSFQLMTCVRTAPTALKNLFPSLLKHYLNFIQIHAPHLLHTKTATMFKNLCKWTKSKRIHRTLSA